MRYLFIIFAVALAALANSCSDSPDTSPTCMWGSCTGGGNSGGNTPSLNEDNNQDNNNNDNDEEPPGDTGNDDTIDDKEETGEPKDPEPKPEPKPEPEPEGDGIYLGKFKFTHYYIVFEDDYPGIKDTKIVDWKDCSTIVKVSKAYYDKVSIEGTGFLSDGRLINKYGNCPGACNMPGYKCFSLVDQTEAPYGHGSHDNPLRPFRSVAVDVTVVPFWTKLYIPALVGMTMPDENDLDPNSPFVHDGCVVAEDEGSSITGKHLDFFVLTETDDNNVIDVIMADLDEVDVYSDSPMCE